MLANENPHLTMVHCSVVKAMFEKEISTIGSVLARKTSNPPLPLPPKKRQPTVRTCLCLSFQLIKGCLSFAPLAAPKQPCKNNDFLETGFPNTPITSPPRISSAIASPTQNVHLWLRQLTSCTA